MSTVPLRRGLDALPPYVPGRRPASVAGDAPAPARLASNEQPWAPPQAVIDAIMRTASGLNRYPDFGSGALVQRLAELLRVDASRVAVGNGSSALIRDLVAALCGPGDEVVFAQPSFPYYRNAAIAAGASPVAVPLADHAHDLGALRAALGSRTRLVFVCNPNNPTGTIVDRRELEAFIDSVPGDVVVAVDEAYIEFASPRDSVIDLAAVRTNVVVLRTFSKAYGLAGMRVGYAMGPEELIGGMCRLAVPFGVNAVAQAAALAALGEDALPEIERRIALVMDERERLSAGLAQRGHDVVPSAANFVFVPTPDAVALAARLEGAGVFVRPIGGGLRISVGTTSENDRVLAAMG